MSEITPQPEYSGVDRRRNTSLGSVQVPVTWVLGVLGAVVLNVIYATALFTTHGNRIDELQRRSEEKEKSFKDFATSQATALKDARTETAANLERLSLDVSQRRNLTDAELVALRGELHIVSDHMIKSEARLELLWAQFPGPTSPPPGGRK